MSAQFVTVVPKFRPSFTRPLEPDAATDAILDVPVIIGLLTALVSHAAGAR